MRNTLYSANPPLPRSNTLRSASGRYSDMLVVDSAHCTPDNPTGMVKMHGKKLHCVHWESYKTSIAGSAPAPPHSALDVILVVRGGDPVCEAYERTVQILNAEIVHGLLDAAGDKQASSRPVSASAVKSGGHTKKPPNLLKIDVSEGGTIMSDLGIKSIPTILMYQGPHLFYAGCIGGRKIKLHTGAHNPQVLYVESNVSHQIRAEKTLRKLGCDVSLCLSLGDAVARIQLMNSASDGEGRQMPAIDFDLVLISDEVSLDQAHLLEKSLKENVRKKRTIVCVLANVLGEHGREVLNAVTWDLFTTTQLNDLGFNRLSQLCSLALQKPIKAGAIAKALAMRELPHEEANFGLTPSTMMSKINSVHDEIISGVARPIKYVGIRMSAADTKLRHGAALTK